MEILKGSIPVAKPILWEKYISIFLLVVLIVLYVAKTIKKHYGKHASGLGSKRGLVQDLLILFIPLVFMMAVFRFAVGITVIQSGSMEPTLMTGNTVFMNRLAYKTGHELERGDIIFFRLREQEENYGKRVIGLPGDTIEFKDGCVVIDGQLIDESDYLSENTETNCRKTFSVPEGCCFVLGDNRKNSHDSRYWENPYVDIKEIQGKYMGQINFSFQRDVFHAITG